MTRAGRICNIHGCPNPATTNGRCHTHTRAADQARGTSRDRGYTTPGHRRFRRLVLDRDPLCVICGAIATVADHYPDDRRALITKGRDPNDPAHGRGLCQPCHSRETAVHQPGGWNRGG